MKDIQFYRSQFWRLQKQPALINLRMVCFIGHNFGDYKNDEQVARLNQEVLSVTILETTKTGKRFRVWTAEFYRSQFWRLQKLAFYTPGTVLCFIGHNFGDYKNLKLLF